MRTHDIVSVHLPQLEAGALALLGRCAGRPTILTYHCDLQLPQGRLNRCADLAVFGSNLVAGACAHRIVAYTRDFAEHSPVLSRYLRKTVFILPPVVVGSPVNDAGGPSRRRRSAAAPQGERQRVIGFAARLASEKGAEHLLAAVEALIPEWPELVLAVAGQHENVLGEEAYRERLQPLLDRCRGHVRFLGVIAPAEMASFYAGCDILVLPSTNSTESFGLVQAEAMLCGIPVVASDLPGVREPIRMTGMGEVVPPGDPHALAGAIRRVLRDPATYTRPPGVIASIFDVEQTVSAYEHLFGQYAAVTPEPALPLRGTPK
jgi:glycosyltransferase involved in cell wall biosynthesis